MNVKLDHMIIAKFYNDHINDLRFMYCNGEFLPEEKEKCGHTKAHEARSLTFVKTKKAWLK